MAYQTITHCCGHEGRHQLYGKHADRDRRAAWIATTPCSACLANAKMERAANQSVENEAAGLPDLKGSDKQIAWALDIRGDQKAAVDAQMAKVQAMPVQPGREQDMKALLVDIVAEIAAYFAETSAHEWIERRYDSSPWNTLAKAAKAKFDARQAGGGQ